MANDPYSAGVLVALTFFIVCVLLSFSPVLETAGRAMVGAFCSGICIAVLAHTNWQAFKFMAPLVGSLLSGILCIALLMIWRPIARHRAISEARKHFPMASESQLRVVASKMLSGSSVIRFSFVDGQMMFGRGQHALKCSSMGHWEPVPTRQASDYQDEEQALVKAIPSAHSILTKAVVHELCVNLYFNWSIDSFELQDNYLAVTLIRRGEKMTKRYACAASALVAIQ
ncbi:hypothetical protein LT708_25050 [Pseudomonas syringae pv. syringae]|uniref:hypothetical protein n=1 Tax=Pseudomonas syringae TaxID=317 RepID=UPI00200B54C1|nr:hypothetical protein [Pseudomonas syringae]MCK9759862.1 hypothetical protein [Pseudomonas syringae pv. syringae]MCK9774853.1 hypothetical protein [Pseudomonas syringae pv. syringae]